MRERVKQITIEDRTFVLKKMPAAKAYAVLVEILTKAMPIDLLLGAMQDFLPASLSTLKGKQMMSMEEMEKLQLKLLSSVSEMLTGGPVQVIDSQGHFQVEDLEDDMLLFGTLLVKVVEFQYADFFTGLLSRMGITLEDKETLLQKSKAVLEEHQMSVSTSLAQ